MNDMPAWLEIQRFLAPVDRRELAPHGHYAEAMGACPACKVEPFHIQGCAVEQDHEGAERILRAGGYCTSCHEAVGYLYAVKPVSIFGEDEDERVLNGRPRVY